MSYVDLAGGFSVVSQRLVESKVVVESLVAFWREYTTIEETYSKSLRELVGSPAASFRSNVILQRFASFFNESQEHFEEGKSLKIGWEQVKSEIEAVANFHSSLSGNLKKEIISKLETYLSESEPRKKQVVNRGKSALSDIKKVVSNLDKEREKYQRLTKEVETLVRLMSETQLSATRNAKIQTQVAGLKKEVESCIVKYKAYVDEHKSLHNSYYIKQQPNILQEMQSMEEERIELVKGTIDQFNELSAPLVSILKSGRIKIKTEAASISSELDIRDYVESLSEYTEEPALPSTEPSDPVSQETTGRKSSFSASKATDSPAKPTSKPPKEDAPEIPPADKPVPNGKHSQQERTDDAPDARPSQTIEKQSSNPPSKMDSDGNKRESTKLSKTLASKSTTPIPDDDPPLAEATVRKRRAQTTPTPVAKPSPKGEHEESKDTEESEDAEEPEEPKEAVKPVKSVEPLTPAEPERIEEPRKPEKVLEDSNHTKSKTKTKPREDDEPPAEPRPSKITAVKSSRSSIEIATSNLPATQPNATLERQSSFGAPAKDPPQTQLKVKAPSNSDSTSPPEDAAVSSTPTPPTTTNRFSAGSFRSSSAISSRIERFSQTSYSTTSSLKKESVPTKPGNQSEAIPQSSFSNTRESPVEEPVKRRDVTPIPPPRPSTESQNPKIEKPRDDVSTKEAVRPREDLRPTREVRREDVRPREDLRPKEEMRPSKEEMKPREVSRPAREDFKPKEIVRPTREDVRPREDLRTTREARPRERPPPEDFRPRDIRPVESETRITPRKLDPERSREADDVPKPATPTRVITRHKSVPSILRAREPEKQPDEEKDLGELLLESLLKTAHDNDIYLLFGIDSSTSADEIGKKRRQLTQQLHPDNFTKGSEEWHDAQKRMALVNQAYNNILRKDAARALYEKITLYRGSYAKLLRKSDGVLQTAANNLYALRESLRTSNMPQFLVQELDQSLEMLRLSRGIRPEV